MLSECVEHKQRGRYAKTALPGGKQIGLHKKLYCDTHNLPYDSLDGQVIRHKCDNCRCLNVTHMELGTHTDNMQDMVKRTRHGRSKLTADQVRWARSLYVPRDSNFGCAALANILGVNDSVLYRAIKGETWTHL